MRRTALLLVSSLAAAVACGEATQGDPEPEPRFEQWTPTTPSRIWPGEAGEPIAVPKALSSLPWLADVSAFGEAGLASGREGSGSFGVGNGRVFGLIGLDSPWNTLTNAIGPGYQRDAGFFGDSWIVLERDGHELPFDEERAQRPRRTAIVRTLGRAGSLSLTTTDAALLGRDVILRHVTVRSEAPSAGGLVVRVRLGPSAGESLEPAKSGLVQARGGRRMLVACEGAKPDGNGSLTLDVPPLEAGDEWSVVCRHSFALQGPFDEGAIDPGEELERARQGTEQALSGALQLASGDRKIDDLYDGALITVLTQTAENGIVSQMSRYTSGWLRDADGSTRLLLAAGLFERARRQLDAVYQSLRVLGRISNSFPLDADLKGFAEPDDPVAFWQGVPFMEKFQPAESPSYFPLLHAMYVDATGDAAILTPPRRAMLEACLLRQGVDERGLLPFSGDETFHIPMGAAVTGLPASVSKVGLSANSSFLLAAAADRLVSLGASAEVAALGARVREAAEATYYRKEAGFYVPILVTQPGRDPYETPYEDVSLGVLWEGYLPPSDERARRNLDATVRALFPEGGLLRSRSTVGFTGMVPGFFLRNVSLTHRPEEDEALAALDRAATPSGHFEEIFLNAGGTFSLAHQADGLGSDIAARYRSWETGDVVAALLGHLVGLEPDARRAAVSLSPHLPHRQPRLEARGVRAGGSMLDLELRGYEQGQVLELSLREGGPLAVTLTMHGERPVRALWVDGAKADGPVEGLGQASFQLGAGERRRVVVAY